MSRARRIDLQGPGSGPRPSLALRALSALASGDDDAARRLLAELLGAPVAEYSSLALPPGVATRKAFARILVTGAVEGATQDGPRGVWRCSREAWEAARRRKPKPAPPKLRLVQDLDDDELAAAALRTMRGSR